VGIQLGWLNQKKRKKIMNKNIKSNCEWGEIAYFAAIRGMVTQAEKDIRMI
jgi:hypothetical protein